MDSGGHAAKATSSIRVVTYEVSEGAPAGKRTQSLLQTGGFNLEDTLLETLLEDLATTQLEAQLTMLNGQRSQVPQTMPHVQMQMHHVEGELKKLQENMAVRACAISGLFRTM
eukprot:1959349-Amphidinium_carterae.1